MKVRFVRATLLTALFAGASFAAIVALDDPPAALSDPVTVVDGGMSAIAQEPGAVEPLAAAPSADPPTTTFGYIGRVSPRSSLQLRAAGLDSPFSIGTEGTERNWSTYAKWASYLGPLGFASARVQTGWADIERTQGIYSWAKLDEIVDGQIAQGVKPWLDLQYGNKLYGTYMTNTLDSPIPAADTPARTAWIAFVRTAVARYKDRVTEWEIWNERDHASGWDPVAFAAFSAETAGAIKAVDPNAKIIFGAFTGGAISDSSGVITALNEFATRTAGTVPPADVEVSYHPYNKNPDDSYGDGYTRFRNRVEAKGFTIRQGENGAPSKEQSRFALSGLPWSEEAQAKWNLRRMLGDFARGIKTSIFTLVDLHTANGINSKGVLETLPDQSIARPKQAYGALQAVTSIFDNRLTRLTTPGCTNLDGSAIASAYTIHAYTRVDDGNIRRNMLVVWRKDKTPYDTTAVAADISFKCSNFNFPRFASRSSYRPRYADLLNARTYQLLSASTVVNSGAGVTVNGLRVYDSPVVLADQGIVQFTP